MSRGRRRPPACYTIDVDGDPVAVRLSAAPDELDDRELDAIRDVIRAARRRLEAMNREGPA